VNSDQTKKVFYTAYSMIADNKISDAINLLTKVKRNLLT